MFSAVNSSCASTLVSVSVFVLVVAVAQFGKFATPILTGSDKSMQQYDSFRIHVERNGHHELVILGNSSARRGVNIRQLQRELTPVLGRTLTAYNFASGGTPAAALDQLAGLVYGVDDPEICVIILSTRMTVTRPQNAERAQLMQESPYGLALGDPIRWRGALQRWLLDHVAFVRLRYSLHGMALGEQPNEAQPGGYEPKFGHLPLKRLVTRSEELERARKEMSEGWLEAKGTQQVLVDTVRGIQAHGAEVWLAEGALHPVRYAAMPEPERTVATARATMSRVAEITGAHALVFRSDPMFSESDFGDSLHLNPRGAKKYTAWLAASLARHLDAAL
jgi:hypothetical protein